MSLTSSPLAVALAIALTAAATDTRAQALPRRDNLEAATLGEVRRDVARDRHVFEIAPGRPVLAPIDGGRVVDIELDAGAVPDVWGSQGGALLVRHPTHAFDARTHAVDTGGTGRRWLRLESADTTRATVHVRRDGRRGGSDPWLVPVDPVGDEALRARKRPGRRDHVLRLADAPVTYRPWGDAGVLRLDVWRTQQPRLLPADATWLRVQADGRTVFDGRVPTPVEREQLHVTDGCAEVLDLAGRLRIEVPHGTREVRVQGEPGVWLKALAPLAGTPANALDVGTDPAREHLMPMQDEPIEQAFGRAVQDFSEPRAQAFLARYAFARPVALRPQDGGALVTRRWRARFPDPDPRAAFDTQRPRPGETPVAALAFHWLAAGARWRIDPAAPGRPGLLRIAVAHAAPTSATASLRLQHAGHATVELRVDSAIVRALQAASSAADGLLAIDAAGAPVVDASQALVPLRDAGASSTLVNTGPHGVWVAVDQRVPAPRQLADAVLDPALLDPERLQDALLAVETRPLTDVPNALHATRDIDHVRRLLAARAQRFAGDACVKAIAGSSGTAGVVAQALAQLADAQEVDPVLARCAALQAFAAAPDEPRVHAAFDDWAARTDQHELRTAAQAWAVQAPARRRDAAAWARLAHALDAEGEPLAGALAARAARDVPAPPVVPTESVPADHAAALVRLRTERETEVAYARASPSIPAQWVLERAGMNTLELRATASVPQWVRLHSGARTWQVLLPAADADATTLRDVVSGAAPGLAVRVPFEATALGQSLAIEPVSGDVLARLDAAVAAPHASRLEPGDADGRAIRVALNVAEACRVDRLDVRIPIHAPGGPVEPRRDAGAVTLDASAPAIADDMPVRTATQAALRALRLVEAGDTDAAHAAAVRALAMREADSTATAPGVFAELDRHVTWRRVEPLAHEGVRAREVADGRSTQPLFARRERWAGIDDDAAFVLRAGQGWVLEGLRPGQTVRLTLQARTALADVVEVRTTRGESRRLRSGMSSIATDTADARGELHLGVGDALPGTFVTLQVAAAEGAPLDGRRPVTYHRGPVAVPVAGPALLRIVEWDGSRSDVRLEQVDATGSVRIMPRRAGGAMRISALVLDPAPAHEAARSATEPPMTHAMVAAIDTDAPPAPWPSTWPDSGGEDGTWGLQAALQQRTDTDDADDRRERFAELRWRRRWQAPAYGLWGRLDVVGRRHDAGFGVLGLQHDLQWRQSGGPWGASLDASAWRQSAAAGLASPAHAASLRAALEWSRRRDERWRDEWELGLRWRTQSLRGVDRDLTAGLDNDVYSRYRDRHRRQLDLGYRVAWRARYDSEWVFDARAVSNELPSVDVDNLGAGLAWRWARHGWTASAGVDMRRYLRDADRREASTRERVELAFGRLLLGADDGWRLRLSLGYDAGSRQAQGGFSVEWFDHDGRGLDDFAPSELFLRGVTETDLVDGLLDPGAAP